MGGREQPGMSAAARQALATYSYPGNVRELRNLIEFALIASRGHTIRPEHLHFLPSDETPVSAPSPLAPAPDAPDALAVPDALAAPDALASQQESSGTTDKTDKDEVRLLAYAAQEGRINNHSVQELLGADHGRASYLLKKTAQGRSSGKAGGKALDLLRYSDVWSYKMNAPGEQPASAVTAADCSRCQPSWHYFTG